MNFTEHLQELIGAIEPAVHDTEDQLMRIVNVLREAKRAGATVFTFGNGGSHSTASHFANDLLKACGIRAICVGDMVPTVYAYNNDADKEEMFDDILITLRRPGDIYIGFSCSGNSANVVRPMLNTKTKTILFTGWEGGKAAGFADIVVRVYNDNIRIQESAHMAYCHAIVEELLDGEVRGT